MTRETRIWPVYLRRGIAALAGLAVSVSGGALTAVVRNDIQAASMPAIHYSPDTLGSAALKTAGQIYKTSREHPASSIRIIGQAPNQYSYQVYATTDTLSLQRHDITSSFPEYRFVDVVFKVGLLDDGELPARSLQKDGSLRPEAIAEVRCGITQTESNPLTRRTDWTSRASLKPAADGWQESALSGGLPHQADPCAVAFGLPTKQG